MDTLIITNHAIARYRQWTNSTKSDEDLRKKIPLLLSECTQIQKQNSLKQLFNNNYKDAEFYLYKEFIIFVIIKDFYKRKIVTVLEYKKESTKLPKFKNKFAPKLIY